MKDYEVEKGTNQVNINIYMYSKFIEFMSSTGRYIHRNW